MTLGILLSYLTHHCFNLIPANFYPFPLKAVLGKKFACILRALLIILYKDHGPI